MCLGLKTNRRDLYFTVHKFHSVLQLPLCWGVGGGVEPPTKFSNRGLDRTSIFRGGLLGGDFFQGGGCNFYMKNKLNSEIFNGKKVCKQKYFSLSLLRIKNGKF